jgi:cytochrome c-type biogenesis protein CcmH
MKRFVSFMVLLALFFTVTVCLVFTQTALAQIPTPTPVAGIENITDDQVNAIARQMFCPVCENTPLDVCPTQACAEWRELIREKLAAGWSEAQIKQYFVDQFGDRVLAAPPARGINWLVYVIPPIAFLAGVYILYRALRTWRQPVRAQEGPGLSPPVEDEYIKRLEEELRKR